MIGFDKNRAVNPYNPFLSMWIEVTRLTDRGKVMHGEEKITRAEALKTHTIWPAYLQFAEKERGSIEAGKLADLVVLDQNPLKVDPMKIKDIKVLGTIKEGKTIYTARE